jgi:hypothetical protein
MAVAKGKQRATVLVQVKISPRAARLLRKRAQSNLRTQAGYLRALIYRDLNLADVGGRRSPDRRYV